MLMQSSLQGLIASTVLPERLIPVISGTSRECFGNSGFGTDLSLSASSAVFDPDIQQLLKKYKSLLHDVVRSSLV